MLSAKSTQIDSSPSTFQRQSNDFTRPKPPTFYPFIPVPGVNNFRDIGGWPIHDGTTDKLIGHVRKGILYRGADVNKITPEGEAKLRELNVKVVFDLRSNQQIQNTGGYKHLEGIERRHTPVFIEEEFTEKAARERYELYAGDGTDVCHTNL
jgi:protein-tyrosine phosphatase family protein